MPIMMPLELPYETPRSERIFFERLNSSPTARAWRVYHSVYLNNMRNPSRPHEIDFVIVIPEYFAIVCVEAKGGVYRIIDGGNRWQNVRSREFLQPSPPQQARNSMFNLKRELSNANIVCRDPESYISYGCAVALPDGNLPPETNLSPQALILDQSDVSSPSRLTQKLLSYALELGGKKAQNPDEVLAARLELNDVIDYLEREEQMESVRITSGYLDTVRELLRLTPEQQTCQTVVANNDRCIIDGGAGTGKTVLAKEIARRICEDEGESVAFLCSNTVFVDHNLDGWANSLSGENGGQIAIGTPATLPLRALEKDRLAHRRHERRLSTYPSIEETLKLGRVHDDWEAFIDETVRDLPECGVFDYLVIDEAQNLCAEPFFRLVDRLLKGGLVSGRWTMFGDFVNQNIVSPSISELGDGKVALKSAYGNIHWVNFPLSTNCRNTQEIAQEMSKLVRIYASTVDGVRGPAVEFDYFNSERQLGEMLDRHVSSWRREGVSSVQVVLLTSDKTSQFDTSRTYGGWRLVNMRDAQTDPPETGLRYSDLYDFQGLESDVVILVLPVTEDQAVVGGVVTLPNETHMRRMFYVGMSRARAVLVIVAHESYREPLELRRELFDVINA